MDHRIRLAMQNKYHGGKIGGEIEVVSLDRRIMPRTFAYYQDDVGISPSIVSN